MARFGLCGPTYQSDSVNADAQRCINFIPEANESGQGNAPFILRGTPGLSVFATLPEGPIRGQFYYNGREFAVGGTKLCEILSGGAVLPIGTVLNDGLPVSFAANQGKQLLIASGGTIYLLDLNFNVLSTPASAPPNTVLVGFSDGYFIALTRNSNLFQLSKLIDGATWSGLDVAEISVFPDNIVSMIVDHREIAILGSKQSVIYFDSGNLFAFDVVPGGFIEQGAGATFGVSRADNSVFWWGADERGQGIAWRNNGYTPQRISNHAIESMVRKYPRISDAVSYSFQMDGHTIWHTYFPSGLNDSGLPLGSSLRYDAATQMWHEVAFWDSVAGRYTAHRSANHAFAFGKHLVGDWNSPNMYEMNSEFVTDFGNPIRRMRRAPHVSTEKQRVFITSLQLDVETGQAQNPQLTGASSTPLGLPSSFTLIDAVSVLWQVSIDDSANIDAIPVASGTPQTVLLNDSGLLPTTSWQIGITIAGNITATPVTFNPTYPQIFPMASTPGNHLTGMLVTVNGLLQTDVPALGRDPQVCLRWSKDSAHTWSNEHWQGTGQPGQFMKRVIWRRLGWAWDWVAEITVSDAVKWTFIDAYLDAAPGYQPIERLVHTLRKQA